MLLVNVVAKVAEVALVMGQTPLPLSRALRNALEPLAASHLLEHTAHTLLCLSATAPSAVPGAIEVLQADFGRYDKMLTSLTVDMQLRASRHGLEGPGCSARAAELRILSGPCVVTYLAVRLTEALHALDGGGRYGLPAQPSMSFAPQPLQQTPTTPAQQPDMQSPNPAAERAFAAAHILSTICASMLRPAPDGTGPSAPGSSATHGSPPGTTSSGYALPFPGALKLAGIYRLLLRTMRLAVRPAGGEAGSSEAGSAAQSLPLPLPVTGLAEAVQASLNAAPGVCALLPRLLGGARRPSGRADARAREVLPIVLALLHAATGGGNGPPPTLGANRVEAQRNAVGCLLQCLEADGLMPAQPPAGSQREEARLAAAVGAGLLPALQSCVACLARGPGSAWGAQTHLVKALQRVIQSHAAGAALLAPERQAGALCVALRSGVAATSPLRASSNSALMASTEVAKPWSDMLIALVDGLYLRACKGADATRRDAAGRALTFALQLLAVANCELAMASVSGLARHVDEGGHVKCGVRQQVGGACLSLLRARFSVQALAEAVTAAQAAGSGAPAAAAARAVRSWRALVLRDMRLLDVLACLVHAAARLPEGATDWAGVALYLLQLLAYALPGDVRQHLAAGQAAARGHSAPPCAAGRGPVWLAVDAPLRALLGPARCRRPALLAFLEGSVQTLPAEQTAHILGALLLPTLPPPCDAQLLEVCTHPACTDQARQCVAAARGAEAPPLRACRRCGVARYCSGACQLAHWNAWHKDECGKGWW